MIDEVMPFGFKARNQSFFCSLVEISLYWKSASRWHYFLHCLGLHESSAPLCTISIGQFFEEDLNVLAIRGILGDQVKSLSSS